MVPRQSQPATDLTADDLAASPVHCPGAKLRWTTANVDEGLPGTVTPLTWSMYFPPTEATMRGCWVDLGVLPNSERPIPEDVDARFLSVAYGHAIANLDLMGRMAARVPGGSAALMEAQLFGSVQGGGDPEPKGLRKMRRYPFVIAKFPVALRRAMRDLEPCAEEIARWWQATVFEPERLTGDSAVHVLVEARRRFEAILVIHMVLSMACQGVMGRVETMAIKAGLEGLQHELIKSDEGTDEFDLVRDLWRLSAESITVEDFLRRHGYHGPREGLVESTVWREDSGPVVELAATYRSRQAAEDVDQLVRRRRREHAAAVRRLEQALGPIRSIPARAVVRFAAHAPTWRETGRATMLRTVDVARAASRIIGRDLADARVLDDPADVRFLTIDEIARNDRGSWPEIIGVRRSQHALFDRMVLPHVWRGVPDIEIAAPTADTVPETSARDTVEGLGVSAGIAEGIVRVVRDLDDADIDEGTVLVCRATDPSWASLFPLAEAVVTDVGSAMSHAAIVCRELGLPCVAGTRNGTTTLRDGMRVRVDGTSGRVEILKDAPTS
ncbi:PEP-utilizing protein [Mycobacterium triplex]|uniref:PEP-utilizing protein n=1 Tax=Mycobacterium triplex TaxID=47839 RepID=A0A024K2M8_9MYCO|nr:PEP-utilizing enzyme [Mycobacterium triplex]ORW99866.1 PEP-utilizing protein [Mycobacterium triplex]CDO90320.1 PEP-utilizing protein [Mycobacterium triplex]